jgi:hypothetical protein
MFGEGGVQILLILVVEIHPTTQCNIPKDNEVQLQNYENLSEFKKKRFFKHTLRILKNVIIL